MKIHHIGYLVTSIDDAVDQFLLIGFTVIKPTVVDSIRNIYVCFMEKDGYVIELVSPVDDNSDIKKLIKKYKNTPYHICYETLDFDNAIQRLTEKGNLMIKQPQFAPAIGNKRVVFFMNKNIGIIELLEK